MTTTETNNKGLPKERDQQFDLDFAFGQVKIMVDDEHVSKICDQWAAQSKEHPFGTFLATAEHALEKNIYNKGTFVKGVIHGINLCHALGFKVIQGKMAESMAAVEADVARAKAAKENTK